MILTECYLGVNNVVLNADSDTRVTVLYCDTERLQYHRMIPLSSRICGDFWFLSFVFRQGHALE